jgi:membrane-bound metal-dependent hydrolase YbcI (DUF457 family)
MASYRGHLAFSTGLGAAYAAFGSWQLGLDWGPACLAGGLTALGGLLPDLDSDSSVPVRELFGLAAAAAPFLLFARIRALTANREQTLVVLACVYLLVRYVGAALFKRLTVHRGMFHSLPGMVITGLIVYLLYHDPDQRLRIYLAVGAALGFLSHLVLDEMCDVDFLGRRPHLGRFAGSPLKLASRSWPATAFAYLLLAVLAFLALLEQQER